MAKLQDEVAQFVRIGAGSFATVYALQSRGFMVLKQVADPQRCAELEKEHTDLVSLHEQVAASVDLVFKVPRPMGYYISYSAFAQDNGLLLSEERSLDPPCLYVMERVHPVPMTMSTFIRDNLFPERFRTDDRPFIARLYLGRGQRERERESQFFNPHNFQLDVPMMERLQLPVGCLAREMGRLLARIHHMAGRDGRDIEFVLGGFDHKRPCYFCIDFNQMRPHTGRACELVDSFYANDPYYPRPGSQHWAEFETGYMYEARKANAASLAQEFIDAVVAKKAI